MGPTGCPETSVRNYRHTLRNYPEERSSHLLRGGSLDHSQEWAVEVTESKEMTSVTLTTHSYSLPNYFTGLICGLYRKLIP